MEIFVSELPKDCSECPMCRSGNLKLQRNGRYVEAQQCVFGKYKYQTIDDEIDTCPLKLISEERKKVVKEIRQKLCRIEDTLINLGNGKEDALSYFVDILNQIEENLSNKN